MSLLFLPIGLVLPTLIGWLAVRLIEQKHPVLFPVERWVLGLFFGLTLSMFAVFLAHISPLSVRFSLVGMGGVQLLLLLILGAVWWFTSHPAATLPAPSPVPSSPLRMWQKVLMILLGLWMAVRLLMAAFVLFSVPPYLDDTLNNWNVRGKVFYYTQELTLLLPGQKEGDEVGGVSSYPPTIPLVKTWLSAVRGEWDEGLANIIHAVWFACVLFLVYSGLRRKLPVFPSFLATYVLMSLPLYFMQGTNAYTDVVVSGYVFAAISFLYFAVSEEHPERQLTFFRLSAFAIALLSFLKNEGLVMYLPVWALLTATSILWLWKQKKIDTATIVQFILTVGIFLAVILIPWVGFKWIHALPFGNAKSISGLSIAYQPGVLNAVFINTFFEANWLLFFPIILGLLIARAKTVVTSPLLLLAAFFLIIYPAQIFLYTFTPLSTEALMQTGHARGLIHLVPVVTMLGAMLVWDVWVKNRD
jgi:hypothetical protein